MQCVKFSHFSCTLDRCAWQQYLWYSVVVVLWSNNKKVTLWSISAPLPLVCWGISELNVTLLNWIKFHTDLKHNQLACFAGVLLSVQGYALEMTFSRRLIHFLLINSLQSRFKSRHEQRIQTCGCFAVLLHSYDISVASFPLLHECAYVQDDWTA